MSHPDQLLFRKGGGEAILFGLAFFVLGMAFVVMGLGGNVEPQPGRTAHPLLLALFGLPWVALGLGLMLGRRGVVVDRRAGSVATWWGLLVPFRSRRHNLADFTRITLQRRVLRTRNSYRIVFPFALAGKGATLECGAPGDYARSQRLAESLAKFTGFDLHDAAGGETIVREAAWLDENVAARARRLGLAPQWPGMPAGCRIQCSLDGEGRVFRIPRPGFPWLDLPMVLLFLGFAAVVIFAFIVPVLRKDLLPGTIPAVRAGALGVLSLAALVPLLVVLVPLLRSIVREITVAASSEGVHVLIRGPFSNRRWTFPAGELEEITANRQGPRETGASAAPVSGLPGENAAPGSIRTRGLALSTRGGPSRGLGLGLRSDHAFCVFGSHLSDAELVWLRDALTFVLVHAPGA